MELNNQLETQPAEQKERKLPPKITKENFLPKGTLKSKIWYVVNVTFILLLSSFLLSFAMHYLIAPNDFATGGLATTNENRDEIAVFFA